MFDQHQKVLLQDGREAWILEVFDGGDAYLVEYETPEGPHAYDDEFVSADMIVKAL